MTGEQLHRHRTARSDRVQRAATLRAEGKLLREIAEEMGVAVQTAHGYLSDPDGAKVRARKDSYRGACADCGTPTDGSNGRDAAPERCVPCNTAWVQKLGRNRVLAAIREWADETGGVPPSATDWNAALAEKIGRHDKAQKFRDAAGRWPTSSSVVANFGTWNAAIEAAGFEPRPQSSYGRNGDDPAVHAVAVELYASGMSSRAVADQLGVARRSVTEWTRAAGIRVRTPWETRHAA